MGRGARQEAQEAAHPEVLRGLWATPRPPDRGPDRGAVEEEVEEVDLHTHRMALTRMRKKIRRHMMGGKAADHQS